MAIRRPTQDNSYLWHVEAGNRQVLAGEVLTADPFTFTAGGDPWRTQSWLMELLYSWFENIGPLASADFVVAISAIALLASVGLRTQSGRGVAAPVGVAWVMWLTLGYFTARPVFPSLALFALLTLVVGVVRLRWTVPLIFWVWGSIHGGFIIGLGYLVLEALRRRDRRFAVDAIVGAGAATVTAHGLGVWGILLSFAGSSSNLDLILEWGTPDFVSIAHAPFMVGIIGLLMLGMAQRLRWTDLWVVVPFLAFAFSANRAVPLAAIAIVPFLFPENSIRVGRAPLAFPVALGVVGLIVVLPWLLPMEEDVFESRFPVEASQRLEPLRTFHDDAAGGYLIYSGFPEIFIDDRAELFGEVYEQFVEARAGKPGWREVFEEYDLRQALLKPEDPLVSLLQAEGWDREYESEDYVVLRP